MKREKRSNRIPGFSQTLLNVSEKGTVATIRVGKDLDLRVCNTFLEAVTRAQRLAASRIVVDLCQTRRLYDSGLAMLMLLHDRAWFLTEKIRITNCRPEIRGRLTGDVFPELFNLAEGRQTSRVGHEYCLLREEVCRPAPGPVWIS